MSASSSSSSSSSSKPWLSWSKELPTTTEARALSAEYKLIHDYAFHKKMNMEIRAKTVALARSAWSIQPSSSVPSASSPSAAIILLMGGRTADWELYDSDTDKCEFRQEAFFRYLFGINEPDCFGAINVTTGQSVLFVPPVSDDAERWMGTRLPLSHYTQRYGVDDTQHTNALAAWLASQHITTLHVLDGENLDSGNRTRTTATFEGMEKFTNVNKTALYALLSEQRVIKTPTEIELLRAGNLVSSQAHVYVMRHIKAGMTELQCEMLYKAWCGFYGGARHCAYTCICGSGGNGAVLHYGHAGRPNDRVLQNGDSVVFDMGAEYVGYATDITRSYAVTGKFTADQRAIHTAVVAAQHAVMAAMKPGYEWRAAHRLAERVILEHLAKIGILHGGSIEEYEKAFLAAVFMPHGLGHLVGLNVHDVGGYIDGDKRTPEPGLCWLRCGRKLEAGMLITVEPGIYFNEPTLNKALRNPDQATYINETVLARFRGTGGVRMEDDVLVTESGCENLTVLPTTADEIEEVMRV